MRAARRCLADLFYLMDEVLFYDREQPKFAYGELHRWMCARVGTQSNELYLLPRDHFKSTFLTVGYAVQRILRDPGISILILSSKDEHAHAFSDQIRRHFWSNERLKALFPPWCKDADWGAVSDWTTPAKAFFGRKRREPTVIASGFKSKLASKHYDLGLFDDVIDEDDTSEVGINQARDNFNKAVPLIDAKTGQIVMAGTRKHYNDLYATIIASGAYTTYVRHGVEGVAACTDCPSGVEPHMAVNWPAGTPICRERYDIPEYKRKLQLSEVNPKEGVGYFFHEYLNLPYSPSERKFQPGWFVQVDESQIPGRAHPYAPLNKWIALDSAWKDDEHPSGYDYTVLVVGGFDDAGRLYVLDILRSREWTMKQGTDAMITLMQAYQISRVITEKAGQVTFHTYARDRARQAGVPLQIIAPKRGGASAKSKIERIMSAQGYFEQARVFFKRDIPCFDDMRDEFCNLGRWTNDDIADAIADFFDEQVKVLAPSARSANDVWQTPLRPVSSESPWRRGAFAAKNDPLGRSGAAGPAVINEPFCDASVTDWARVQIGGRRN